jgi:hypothetical protein
MECGGLAAAFIFATGTAETHPNGRVRPNTKAAAMPPHSIALRVPEVIE